MRIPRITDDILVALCAFAVYGLTLAPTVTTGDSGELITASATLSLAHPTGYPFYVMLGHLFVRLFAFTTPAVAMNLFSAIAAAATCGVVRRLAETLSKDRMAAAATALLLAFSPSFWSQATAARVYALGALLTALTLLELARLHENEGGSLGRAWLWFGFAMANHTVAVVMGPLLLLATLRAPVSWRARFTAAALCLPGLACYAYIPIAASFDPVQSWGDPSEGQRLLAYLTRESFWSKRFVRELSDLWLVAAHYLDRIPVELSWPGAALLLLGIGTSRGERGRRTVVWAGLYLFVANAAMLAWHGSRQDIFYWSRYVMTGWLALTLLAGLGLARVLAELERSPGRRLLPLRTGIAALIPLLALGFGYETADRSSHTWARDFGVALLAGLEPGALLLAEEDNVVFPLSYLHYVEGLRPDVEIVMQGVNRLDQLGIQPDRRPTYLTHPRDLGSPALTAVPDGLAFRLVTRDMEFVGRPWSEATLPSFEAVRAPGVDRYLDRSLVGNYYFLKALNLEARDPAAAMEAVRTLRVVSFDNSVNQVNAGLLFERSGHVEAAAAAFSLAASIDPRNDLAVARARLWREALDQARSAADSSERTERLAAALAEAGQIDLAVELLEGLESQAPGPAR